MSTLIIGDLHFYDKRILNLCNRPFRDVEHMNESLVQNWNGIVKESDEVIINGDLTGSDNDWGDEDLSEIIRSMNGYKILLLGNHDEKPTAWYLENGIDEVNTYPIFYKNKAIISHEPIYLNKRIPYVNIYAHVHDNPLYQTISPWGACTSAERINYTPISLNALLDRVGEIKWSKEEMEDETILGVK